MAPCLLALRSGTLIYIKPEGLEYSSQLLPVPNVISATQLDENRIAVATKDSPVVNFITLEPFQIVESIKADSQSVLYLAGNSEFLVTVSAKSLRFWDVVAHALVSTSALSANSEVVAVAMASASSSCFVAERRRVYSLVPNAVESEISSFSEDIRDMAISDVDGRLSLLVGKNKVVDLEISSRKISQHEPDFLVAHLCTSGAVEISDKTTVWPFDWLRVSATGDVSAIASLARKYFHRMTKREISDLLSKQPHDALEISAQLASNHRLPGISSFLFTASEKTVRDGHCDWRAVEIDENFFLQRSSLLSSVSLLQGKLDLLHLPSLPSPVARPAIAKVPSHDTLSTDEDEEQLSLL